MTARVELLQEMQIALLIDLLKLKYCLHWPIFEDE
jgi:hypothetical protein